MKTLYIWLLVSWKTLTGNIPIEKLEALLESAVSEAMMIKKDVVSAIYPDWVKSHLTSELETGKSTGVQKYRLEYHPSQIGDKPRPTGPIVYAWLISNGWLSVCIELADLQWWEKHPNEIPEEFKGKLIYAWGSVVLNDFGDRCVPCLGCNGDKPFVDWYNLDNFWNDLEPACLRTS